MTVAEGSRHLSLHEDVLRHYSQRSKTHLVFDPVAHNGAVHASSHLGFEFMPVMPGFERTSGLDVGEVLVPLEPGDLRNPLRAEGKKRQNAEGVHNLRPNTSQGGATGVSSAWSGGDARRSTTRAAIRAACIGRGRHQLEPNNARPTRG